LTEGRLFRYVFDMRYRALIGVVDLILLATIAIGQQYGTSSSSHPVTPKTPAQRYVDHPGIHDLPPIPKPIIERNRSILAGLRYLIDRQAQDGTWDGEGGKRINTALVLCAFLGANHTIGSTAFGDRLDKANRWYREQSTNSTMIVEEYGAHLSSQALSALLFVQAYKKIAIPSYLSCAENYCNGILKWQMTQKHDPADEGGWGTSSKSSNSNPLVSFQMILALRQAKLAGVANPQDALEKASRYLQQFASSHSNADSATRAQCALPCAMATLDFEQMGFSMEQTKGDLDFLASFPADWGKPEANSPLLFWYFKTLAMHTAGGKYWDDWYEKIVKELMKHQHPDGHWDAPPGDKLEADYGPIYTTALCCLILEVGHRYILLHKPLDWPTKPKP
jgi:hypothetical protein